MSASVSKFYKFSGFIFDKHAATASAAYVNVTTAAAAAII
jgi:hypothetical protein